MLLRCRKNPCAKISENLAFSGSLLFKCLGCISSTLGMGTSVNRWSAKAWSGKELCHRSSLQQVQKIFSQVGSISFPQFFTQPALACLARRYMSSRKVWSFWAQTCAMRRSRSPEKANILGTPWRPLQCVVCVDLCKGVCLFFFSLGEITLQYSFMFFSRLVFLEFLLFLFPVFCIVFFFSWLFSYVFAFLFLLCWFSASLLFCFASFLPIAFLLLCFILFRFGFLFFAFSLCFPPFLLCFSAYCLFLVLFCFSTCLLLLLLFVFLSVSSFLLFLWRVSAFSLSSLWILGFGAFAAPSVLWCWYDLVRISIIAVGWVRWQFCAFSRIPPSCAALRCATKLKHTRATNPENCWIHGFGHCHAMLSQGLPLDWHAPCLNFGNPSEEGSHQGLSKINRCNHLL